MSRFILRKIFCNASILQSFNLISWRNFYFHTEEFRICLRIRMRLSALDIEGSLFDHVWLASMALTVCSLPSIEALQETHQLGSKIRMLSRKCQWLGLTIVSIWINALTQSPTPCLLLGSIGAWEICTSKFKKNQVPIRSSLHSRLLLSAVSLNSVQWWVEDIKRKVPERYSF